MKLFFVALVEQYMRTGTSYLMMIGDDDDDDDDDEEDEAEEVENEDSWG